MSSEIRNPENEPSSQPTNAAGPVDLQIVGGGLAGLVAANLATDAGLSVRLIEKQRSVGGRANSSIHEGFTVNQGPHALYLTGELNVALKRLQITPSGAQPELKGALGSIGGNVDLLPQGPGSLLKTSLLPARGKRHLATIMAKLPRMKPGPLASCTVDQWLADLTDVPELRTLVGGLVNLSTYNSASHLASADAALAQTQRAMGDGVIYVDGGWETIVAALLTRLAEPIASGRLERINASAISVRTPQGGNHHIVETADGAYPAANVLLAPGAPGVVDRLLGDDTGTLAEAAGPPVKAAVLDIGVRGVPEASIHLGLDRGLYYSKHSGAAGMAPAGQTLIALARYVRPGDELPAQETKALLLAHAEASGIDPADITMTRYLHKLTVSWGMPLASRDGLAGRPTPELAGRAGLFIAGDWVGNRGLLADASAASASDVVESVVADGARRAAKLAAVG